MQIDDARHAEQQFARALGERQRERRFRRQADKTREQQITAFLHAERSGNGKGRAANRLAETFEQQGFGPADRMPEQVEYTAKSGAPIAAANRNGVMPFRSVTSGIRYSTSSVSKPAIDACCVSDLPTIDSMRMRRKKISATATPAMPPSHCAATNSPG